MKKRLDKSTALKLINQYADNYKRLEEENRNLQNEIIDLKSNLNVNKEIIGSFFKNDKAKLDVKFTDLFSKKEEEIKLLNERNETLTKENSSLRIKNLKYETVISNSFSNYYSSSNELNNRIFILENALKKKNNIIEWLKKKVQTLKDSELNFDYYNEANEIFIADPNETLNIIYNDLLLYKQAYESALNQIKQSSLTISSLQEKVSRLASANNPANHESPKSAFAETSKALTEMILKCTRKDWETDEWLAILNYLNITKEDIKNNSNKFTSKLFDAIELLNKIVSVRNKKINELSKEKDKLKESNKTLSEENIQLMKNILKLKNKNEKGDEQYINTNISMVNNISFEEQREGTGIKTDFLKKLLKTSGNNPNNSMTLESDNKDRLNMSIPKTINLTQVSENSFGIIDSDVVGQLNEMGTKKNIKKINCNDSISSITASENNSSVIHIDNKK